MGVKSCRHAMSVVRSGYGGIRAAADRHADFPQHAREAARFAPSAARATLGAVVDASVSGTGEIVYAGNPVAVTRTVTGTGSVTAR